jgi:hypothetical protein
MVRLNGLTLLTMLPLSMTVPRIVTVLLTKLPKLMSEPKAEVEAKVTPGRITRLSPSALKVKPGAAVRVLVEM